MLRNAGPSVSGDIDEMVEELLREESDYDRVENRSTLREHLVRCVRIQMRNKDLQYWAFSRNVSLSGIGLITEAEIPDGSTATLTIERLDGTSSRVLAESRWCKRYGNNWFISGWQFLNLQ